MGESTMLLGALLLSKHQSPLKQIYTVHAPPLQMHTHMRTSSLQYTGSSTSFPIRMTVDFEVVKGCDIISFCYSSLQPFSKDAKYSLQESISLQNMASVQKL